MIDLNKIDHDFIWHPCSQMKDYEENPSILIDKAKGVWLYKKNGEKILDAISSWWVTCFGHGNEYIKNKIKNQIDKLEHVLYANYTHEPSIILAKHLSTLFDNKLSKVFYTDNGSSSVEVALKMSYHYWYNMGKSKKKVFVYLKGAYHGETLGALSVGSIDTYKKIYNPLLPETIEVKGPDCYRCPFQLNREKCNAECFNEVKDLFEKRHENIASIIVEPIVQGAAGMCIYSPQYLKKLRKICDNYDIHLICDEIATGFAKTGKMMATHHADIVPDFVTVSKAVTGGFLPLAAVLTSKKIYDAFYGKYEDMKAFMHSHTYSGNPLACAAGCAVFDMFNKEDIVKNNIEKGKYIRDNVLSLMEHPNIGEIRTIGIITAIEIVKDKKSKEKYDWKKRIGYKIYRNAEKKGVMLRNLGDILYFLPPFIINNKEIDFMTDVAKYSILEILKDV